MGFADVMSGVVLGENVVSYAHSSFLTVPFGGRNTSSQIPVTLLNTCKSYVKLDKLFML